MHTTNSDAHVTKTYILNEYPTVLGKKLNNEKVHHILLQTDCCLDIRPRILNQHHRTTQWTKGSVIEITGPTHQLIDHCDCLIGSVLPFYLGRKPYATVRCSIEKRVDERNNHLTHSNDHENLRSINTRTKTWPTDASNSGLAGAGLSQIENLSPQQRLGDTESFGSVTSQTAHNPRVRSCPTVSSDDAVKSDGLQRESCYCIASKSAAASSVEPTGDEAQQQNRNEHNVAKVNGRESTVCATNGSRLQPYEYIITRPAGKSPAFLRPPLNDQERQKRQEARPLKAAAVRTNMVKRQNDQSRVFTTQGAKNLQAAESRPTTIVRSRLSQAMLGQLQNPTGDDRIRPTINAISKLAGLKAQGMNAFTPITRRRVSGRQSELPTVRVSRNPSCTRSPNGVCTTSHSSIGGKWDYDTLKVGKPTCLSRPNSAQVSSISPVCNNLSRIFNASLTSGFRTEVRGDTKSPVNVTDACDPKVYYACVAGHSVASDETASTFPTTILPCHYRLTQKPMTDANSDAHDCSYGTCSYGEHPSVFSRARTESSTDKWLEGHDSIPLNSERTGARICQQSKEVIPEPDIIPQEAPNSNLTQELCDHSGLRSNAPLGGMQLKTEAIAQLSPTQSMPESSCNSIPTCVLAMPNQLVSSIIPNYSLVSTQRVQEHNFSMGLKVGILTEEAHSLISVQDCSSTKALMEGYLEQPAKVSNYYPKCSGIQGSTQLKWNQTDSLIKYANQTNPRNKTGNSIREGSKYMQTKFKQQVKNLHTPTKWNVTGPNVQKNDPKKSISQNKDNVIRRGSSNLHSPNLVTKTKSSALETGVSVSHTTNKNKLINTKIPRAKSSNSDLQKPATNTTNQKRPLETRKMAKNKTQLNRSFEPPLRKYPSMNLQKLSTPVRSKCDRPSSENSPMIPNAAVTNENGTRSLKSTITDQPALIASPTQLMRSRIATFTTRENPTSMNPLNRELPNADPMMNYPDAERSNHQQRKTNAPLISNQTPNIYISKETTSESQRNELKKNSLTPSNLPRPSPSSAWLMKTRGSKETLDQPAPEACEENKCAQKEAKRTISPQPNNIQQLTTIQTPASADTFAVFRSQPSLPTDDSNDDSPVSLPLSRSTVTSTPISGLSDGESPLGTPYLFPDKRPRTNLFSPDPKDYGHSLGQTEDCPFSPIKKPILPSEVQDTSTYRETTSSEWDYYKKRVHREPNKISSLIQRCIPWFWCPNRT